MKCGTFDGVAEPLRNVWRANVPHLKSNSGKKMRHPAERCGTFKASQCIVCAHAHAYTQGFDPLGKPFRNVPHVPQGSAPPADSSLRTVRCGTHFQADAEPRMRPTIWHIRQRFVVGACPKGCHRSPSFASVVSHRGFATTIPIPQRPADGPFVATERPATRWLMVAPRQQIAGKERRKSHHLQHSLLSMSENTGQS